VVVRGGQTGDLQDGREQDAGHLQDAVQHLCRQPGAPALSDFSALSFHDAPAFSRYFAGT